jgi:hypothetical protein
MLMIEVLQITNAPPLFATHTNALAPTNISLHSLDRSWNNVIWCDIHGQKQSFQVCQSACVLLIKLETIDILILNIKVPIC